MNHENKLTRLPSIDRSIRHCLVHFDNHKTLKRHCSLDRDWAQQEKRHGQETANVYIHKSYTGVHII